MAYKSWFPTWREGHDVEPFRGVKTQIDSLFEDWFGRSIGGVLAPRVDIAEDGKAVTVTAELPGVKQGDIEVALVGDQLSIKGEKRSEHTEQGAGGRLHRMERSYGAFQRILTLPYQVDPGAVSAQFKDGVLTITMLKPADATTQKQGHRIEINTTASPSGSGTPGPDSPGPSATTP
jgi:HSP20 family protein